MDKLFHIAGLIAQKQRGELDEEGQRKLEQWLEEDPVNREIMERTANGKQLLEKMKVYAHFDQDRVQNRLEEELFGQKIHRLNTRALLRYAAVIILPLLFLGGAAWWYLGRSDTNLLAEIDTHIHPGHRQAFLVLSDGSSIELDQSRPIDILEEEDATITEAEQGIRYESKALRRLTRTTVYNKLITPHGGSYKLTLSDGSRIWLNAGSSLRFPVTFHDSLRQVFLEGEAYFEVRPAEQPFIVSSGNMDTRVLGTSFNVSAYNDDVFIRTTLVEGKVKVIWKAEERSEGQSAILEPDQQASCKQETGVLNVAAVDAGGFISWVNGKMEFHRENLEQVMKRLSRWYDFEYEFENNAARELSFSARLDRSSQISEILEMLALTTEVSFEYRGNRIVVH